MKGVRRAGSGKGHLGQSRCALRQRLRPVSERLLTANLGLSASAQHLHPCQPPPGPGLSALLLPRSTCTCISQGPHLHASHRSTRPVRGILAARGDRRCQPLRWAQDPGPPGLRASHTPRALASSETRPGLRGRPEQGLRGPSTTSEPRPGSPPPKPGVGRSRRGLRAANSSRLPSGQAPS